MPSLKDLKNRIDSVKSTRKITKAMQMVAAAKLRRAQEAAEASEPYVRRMDLVLGNLARSVEGRPAAPRLLTGTGSDQVHLLVVATAERGLCGGFNSSIAKLARSHADALIAEGKTVKILTIGKKGREQLKRTHEQYFIDHVDLTEVKRLRYRDAHAIGSEVLRRFCEGEFDVATLFYSKFISVMSQEPMTKQLIPAKFEHEARSKDPDAEIFYEYEPGQTEMLSVLLPGNVSSLVFKGLLENAASEQGARMSAMDSATRNAGEMIDKLTIEYNRSRQAAITKELIEIISGAEAL